MLVHKNNWYKKKQEKGFTLIELMIAMMLGLIVIGGALSIYISTVTSSSNTIKSARLNYDVKSVIALMSNDMKRAGYWGGAVVGSDSRDNVFMAAATNLQIRNLAAPTTAVNTGNCILYSYDADADANVDDNNDVDDVDDTDELYGFRLSGTSIQMRLAGATTSDCDLEDDSWQAITTDNVEVTNLQFSFLPVGTLTATTRCLNNTTATSFNTLCSVADDTAGNINSGDLIIESRVLNIIIAGRVGDDNDVVQTFSETVQVRNNRTYTQL